MLCGVQFGEVWRGMQYNVVCCIVQGTVVCSAGQHGSTVQCSAVQCSTKQHSVACSVEQCGAIHYGVAQGDAI